MNHGFAAPKAQRIETIDALRGVALLGVLVVNLVTEFRVSIFEQFVGTASHASALDRFAASLVSLVAEGKAICLSSLLFGVGLAMQFDHFSKTGRPYYWLGRRLLVLLGFGLVHLVLIWNGDILTEYALVGLIALPFLGISSQRLGIASVALLAWYAAMPLLPIPISFPDHAELQAHVAAADTIYPTGRFFDIWRFSVAELRLLLPLHLYIVPRTLALFLLGAYVWRSGLLQSAMKHSSNVGAAAVALVISGIIMTLVNVGSVDATFGVLGPVLSQLAPVILALGYAASIFALSRHDAAARWLSLFAPLGRMAFTNYLSQSVIFSLLFFGYGLGLYGRTGVAATLALGVAVYAIQLLWSAWWLNRFRFGPLEWCWRIMTYGKLQALRRSIAQLA